MKPDLGGHCVLITGAGRGLGRHAATHLAGCGATVGVVDIDGTTAEDTAEAIRRQGGQARAWAGDVSDRDTFLGVADEFAGHAGRIDTIINNAMLLHYCPVQDIEPQRLDAMLAVGIKAPFWSAQALLKHYDRDRGGHIINLGSPVAQRGYPGTSIYSAVKGAVTVLTRTLAAELGPQGIRVNAVSPASVPTPGSTAMVSREEYARRAATIPLRRNGTEEDNSNAIAFLLSAEAAFIHGEILNVDGGASACA